MVRGTVNKSIPGDKSWIHIGHKMERFGTGIGHVYSDQQAHLLVDQELGVTKFMARITSGESFWSLGGDAGAPSAPEWASEQKRCPPRSLRRTPLWSTGAALNQLP